MSEYEDIIERFAGPGAVASKLAYALADGAEQILLGLRAGKRDVAADEEINRRVGIFAMFTTRLAMSLKSQARSLMDTSVELVKLTEKPIVFSTDADLTSLEFLKEYGEYACNTAEALMEYMKEVGDDLVAVVLNNDSSQQVS